MPMSVREMRCTLTISSQGHRDIQDNHSLPLSLRDNLELSVNLTYMFLVLWRKHMCAREEHVNTQAAVLTTASLCHNEGLH